MKVRCINDLVPERYGFLWLKTRMVKDARITEGKEYTVKQVVLSEYGSDGWMLIECDLGYPQLIESKRLKVLWKSLDDLVEVLSK